MSFTLPKRLLQLLTLQLALMAPPALAAQEVFVNVSAFEASVSVEALQDYGKTGKATGLLRKLLDKLSPEVRQQAQTLFATRVEVNPVILSDFLYTHQGEMLLKQLGQIFQSESGYSGFSGLRAALYQAAQDPEGGLTLPNVLKHVPGDRIRLNTARLSELGDAWQTIATVTGGFELPMPKVTPEVIVRFPLAQQLELRNAGKFNWSKAADLETSVGDRASVYIPTGQRGQVGNANPSSRYPVVFISHGLGGDRTSFTYLAEYLASHGFAVVVPEHQLASQRFRPRGEAAPVLQADQLLDDDWAKKIGPQDFVQRPRAITRLLDELEKRQQQDLSAQPDSSQNFSQLNLEQVGVVGQSMGAYTSLALGGAQVDLAELAQHCPADAITFNPSLALQCRALGLREGEMNHRDPRIKAIAAINPLGSALFGPEGMAEVEVPVLMMAGSHDFVTPPHAEQLPTFQWLTHPHRYFGWLRGGTHFSVIQASDDASDRSLVGLSSQTERPQTKGLGPKEAVEAEQAMSPQLLAQSFVGQHHDQAKTYLQASSLAFFQTHLAQKAEYAKFLTPEFAALLSQGKEMAFALNQEL